MSRDTRHVPVLVAILVALTLAIAPLPPTVAPYRPDWVALTLIYWSMTLPRTWSVGTAWLTGIVLDVAEGTLLGQHALQADHIGRQLGDLLLRRVDDGQPLADLRKGRVGLFKTLGQAFVHLPADLLQAFVGRAREGLHALDQVVSVARQVLGNLTLHAVDAALQRCGEALLRLGLALLESLAKASEALDHAMLQLGDAPELLLADAAELLALFVEPGVEAVNGGRDVAAPRLGLQHDPNQQRDRQQEQKQADGLSKQPNSLSHLLT